VTVCDIRVVRIERGEEAMCVAEFATVALLVCEEIDSKQAEKEGGWWIAFLKRFVDATN